MNTIYFLNLIAGNVFRSRVNPPIPSKYYVGLSQSTPNTSGGNVTEPSASEYKRVELTGLSVPANGVIKNSSPIIFNKVGATNWGTLTYYTVHDSISGGNLLFYGQLTKSKLLEQDDIMRIEPNGISLSFIN